LDINDDEFYMGQAIKQALLAQSSGEVPVGAVIVQDQRVIGCGFNQSIQKHDATAHAEIMAIRAAGKATINYRLPDCTLYVTLEPCVMCVGAIFHARIKRLVYAAADPKTGACGSVVHLPMESRLNHHLQVTAGVLALEAGALLTNFFAQRRRAVECRHHENKY